MALKRREYLLLAGLIVAVTLLALPLITYPLGRDQGVFATIGRSILDGRIPYIDLWDIKPPAVFYVYAASIGLFGRSSEAVRVIDLLLFPPIAVALYWIGRRMADGRVGLWAALLFGVFYFSETFWTLTQNDGIALLPMVLAVACAIKAADGGERSALWAFGAGALCAYAIWFKYPFAIFAGVLVFAYIWLRARSRAPLQRRDMLAFAAGGALIGAGGVAYMLAVGAWDTLVETAGATASAVIGVSGFVELFVSSFGFRWQHWGALFIFVVIALIFAARRFNRHFWLSPEWIVAVWLIAGAAIMLVQLKFFDYHWLPMLPPLALIGAAGIEALVSFIPSPPLLPARGKGRKADLKSSLPGNEREAGRAETGSGHGVSRVVRGSVRGILAVALLAALAAVIGSRTLPYLTGREDQTTYYSHFQAGEFVADESLQVVNFLRQHVVAGDSLFIWGFRPEVYYLSQLNPAVRFIGQFPLVASWYPPEWRDQTVEILWAALPPYVLVLQGDYLPWITGGDKDSNTELQGYTELNNWLEFNYVRDSQIGNFFIWRRTSIPK